MATKRKSTTKKTSKSRGGSKTRSGGGGRGSRIRRSTSASRRLSGKYNPDLGLPF